MEYRGKKVKDYKPMGHAHETFIITYEDGGTGIAHKNALFGEGQPAPLKQYVDEVKAEIALKPQTEPVVTEIESSRKWLKDTLPDEVSNALASDVEEFDNMNEAQKQQYLQDSENFISQLEAEGKDASKQRKLDYLFRGK